MASVAAVILFTSVSNSAYSQSDKISVSINSLTTNFSYGKSNAALETYKKSFRGLQAGFSYQAGISPEFSVVPEIYFSMKGGTLRENNPVTGGRSTLRINSLEMPILARLHCNKLYLNAGPYAGYHVGGRLKVAASGAVSETTTKVTFGHAVPNIKRWDWGFQAGAGYNFNVKQSALTLDVRYGFGLVNISQDVERYNRILNISLKVSKSAKRDPNGKQG